LHSYAIDQIGFVQPVFSINGEPAYHMIEEIKPSATGRLNCVGKKYNAVGKTPFYFLTPVFDVNETAFIQGFKDNKAVEEIIAASLILLSVIIILPLKEFLLIVVFSSNLRFKPIINLTFTAGAGSVFQMAGLGSNIIKYFIKCALCDQKIIVDNGNLHADVTSNTGVVTVPVGPNPNKIDFKLSVGYNAQEYDNVVTGSYTGSFIVIFEVDI